jgi:phospholipid/cholesterol/gamma-HCH transport system substrate-binding protein
MSSQIDPLLKKADSAMKEVNGIAAQLNASDIEGLLKSVNSLLENVQDPDGSLGKLINNGDMYNSVNELLNDVSSLVKKIEQNPKKYIRISIF